ncbi:hypothetical protein PPERSA_11457 [Pseudocohnilembus persalinus]|uniref:Pex19 protein n=1 Tax=Pseudocohnilembus persalinus TaxID=266149 RepID=A0A0V0QWR6_PSEPJ|nr:hypothetical protein PPERSA_11457 [Pseudocohnilembus persalinus]|eukprot:KRX06812.1 hypothetical protein PPERSA_11457 [Pseudocohnilembus persalinus]
MEGEKNKKEENIEQKTEENKLKKEQENKKQQEDEEDDDLDQGLDDFDDDKKLDVTLSEKDPQDDEDFDPQTDKEFQEFMKQMKDGLGLGEDEQGLGDVGGMVSQLLQGLSGQQQEGQNKQGNNNNKDNNKSDDMFKNFDQNGDFMDQLADNLLKEFMDKDILLEPLKDAKENYSKYLEENEGKIDEKDYDKYVNQLACIDEILEIIDKDPNNKQDMIAKFEKMQEFGTPPPELLASWKNSPFQAFAQMAGQQKQEGQQQQEQGGNPFEQMFKQQGGGDGQQPDCNIF